MSRRNLMYWALAAMGTVCLGLFLMLRPAAVDAQGLTGDRCLEAVDNLYNDCYLQIAPFGVVMSFSSAVSYCQAQTDMVLKSCWTNCAISHSDCGDMAACVDACFDGELSCMYQIEYIYDRCAIRLLDVELPEETPVADDDDNDDNDDNTPPPPGRLDREEAMDRCEEDPADELQLCYRTCAYDNWQDCDGMKAGIEDCYPEEPVTDDDDDNDDNDTDAEEDDSDGGNSGGSGCGC